MSDESNNETWMLRSARLDKPSQVQKLLREGFEPFWGVTINVTKNINGDGVVEKDKVVKMYFRKPPVYLVEAMEQQPVKFDLEPVEEFSNHLRSSLSGVLDTFVERFFARLAESQASFRITEDFKLELDSELGPILRRQVSEHGAHRELKLDDEGIEDLSNQEQPADNAEPRQDDRAAPTGDDFRVVEDVPPTVVISTSERTPQQEATIEALRKKGNITMLPNNTNDSNIRILIGSEEYTINPGGNFTVKDTGAKTNSLGI